MTENEINRKLEVLKDWVGDVSLTRQDMQNAIDEAIQTLEEIQQYRAIGTVKEIKIKQAEFTVLSERYLNDLTLLREYQAIGTVEECKDAVENIERFYQLGYNKAIDDVFDFLKSKRDKRHMKICFDDLEIRKYKEQLKEGVNNESDC